MSGRQTKATNRQIRKAFGDEALDTIARLQNDVRALEEDNFKRVHAECTARLELAKQQRAYIDSEIRKAALTAHDNLNAFARMPWWRRWWWVVSGR